MDVKRRIPLLRWSVWRLVVGAHNIPFTGQIGDGREAAAADYVIAHARRGDIDDVLRTLDRFACEKSILINVGDEKGALLDAAVRRADPRLALELGTYCGYSDADRTGRTRGEGVLRGARRGKRRHRAAHLGPRRGR